MVGLGHLLGCQGQTQDRGAVPSWYKKQAADTDNCCARENLNQKQAAGGKHLIWPDGTEVGNSANAQYAS